MVRPACCSSPRSVSRFTLFNRCLIPRCKFDQMNHNSTLEIWPRSATSKFAPRLARRVNSTRTLAHYLSLADRSRGIPPRVVTGLRAGRFCHCFALPSVKARPGGRTIISYHKSPRYFADGFPSCRECLPEVSKYKCFVFIRPERA